MLWLGDSTARRAAMTLYALLESGPDADMFDESTTNGVHEVAYQSLTNRSVIDVNKGRVTVPCTKWGPINNTLPYKSSTGIIAPLPAPAFCKPMPHSQIEHPGGSSSQKEFIIHTGGCTKVFEYLLELELELLAATSPSSSSPSSSGRGNNATESDDTSNSLVAAADVIVIANGIWEPFRPRDCRVPGRNITDILAGTIDKLDQVQRRRPGTVIVWRTSGFSATPAPNERSIIYTINTFVMDRIDELAARYRKEGIRSNLTYVHWGGAVGVRSHGDGRIKGDIDQHYGLEPRLTLVQMITNRLQEYRDNVSLDDSESSDRTNGSDSGSGT